MLGYLFGWLYFKDPFNLFKLDDSFLNNPNRFRLLYVQNGKLVFNLENVSSLWVELNAGSCTFALVVVKIHDILAEQGEQLFDLKVGKFHLVVLLLSKH